MAEPTSPAAEPAPQAPPPQEPAKGTKDSRFTVKRECKFCHTVQPVSHEQWCKQNPNRRTVAIMRKGAPKAAKKAPAAKPAKATAPKPAAEPTQEAFLRERSEELRTDTKTKAPAPASDPSPAPAKKMPAWATWVVVGIFLLGAALLIWRLAAPGGQRPVDDGPDNAGPQLEANAEIPGIGKVHVPGLSGAS